MAWEHYYINSNAICDLNESEKDTCFVFNLDIPPHGGIRREWTTIGMKHGNSKILFVEYRLEDDDPDGVWEAYGQKAESEYRFTVNVDEADPEKLFVYTLYTDGNLRTGFDIDTDNAQAILVFLAPQKFSAGQLMTVAEKAKDAFREQDVVKNLVMDTLLNNAEHAMCLAFFRI